MESYHDQAREFFEMEVDPETDKFVELNLGISKFIRDTLKSDGLTLTDLANKTGKSVAEISKLLSGIHNLTLKSIAKLSVALDIDVVKIPKRQASAKVILISYEDDSQFENKPFNDQKNQGNILNNKSIAYG